MYLDNGKISARQTLRIGILENIPVGIVLVPFLTTRLAGDGHVSALLLGLLFFIAYCVLIYIFSRGFKLGFMDTLHIRFGVFGRALEGVYALRYVIKAAIITIFFAKIVQEYMLRGFNLWPIIISFILLCGYGSARDIEKRGRLLELLFWWMIVPLILVVVFSITNIRWDVFKWPGTDGGLPALGVWEGAYSVLIVLSSVELMMMTIYHERKHQWRNSLSIMIWIVIAVVLAYVYVIGILGQEWVSHGRGSALNVLQAQSFLGGTVSRLDYSVFSFWIIGVFSTVSGYMFYAKEFAASMLRLERQKSYSITNLCMMALVATAVFLMNYEWFSRLIVDYLIWADIAVSVIVPLILFIAEKVNIKKQQTAVVVMCLCLAQLLTGCNGRTIALELTQSVTKAAAAQNQVSSLEKKAYVVCLTVSSVEDAYSFSFEVADLSDYSGDIYGKLNTKSYEYKAKTIEEAAGTFFEENELKLDMGHMDKLVVDGNWRSCAPILYELSTYPNVAKSLSVSDENDEYILRELVIKIYSDTEVV